ncbi:radical SAM protein [Anaeromyxobacter oryzae]|uniref:Radical SAM core domain-containing protein n=1 Tax=Anaeromyxobacter oryzae TaxID=2918170 RepID=A0ABM7WTX9_9BACT|nr:radical SAM protein [Anaeromyxobacter oryzae]BDG02847.1 hypothetical protein AMOR_18430 [Anaeromyxobacter oryzae]
MNRAHAAADRSSREAAPDLRPARSPVPDLLFEDTQERRLTELRPLLDAPERLGPETPLHRFTVFVTPRCNLACTYCKGAAAPGRGRAADHDLASFARLLATHDGTEIRHVHFTGGEASLLADLPAMIRLAKARGVRYTSVTTNGTRPPRCYLDLVAAGIDEIRVSLGAADPHSGDITAGRPGAWSAAIRTLAALGAARRDGAGVFLVVNMVVHRGNRHRLQDTVRFLLGLAPDDLKLLCEVDARGDLGAFREADEVRADLEQLLRAHPAGALPLLRLKVRTVFRPDALGLEAVRRPAARPWRCWIPLTERTADATSYYPCSIYLREGGAPLGPLSDAPEVQRARSAGFVRDADCLSDPICRRYCLNCTRTFNVRANEVCS